MAKRINHQSDVSLKSDISDDSIPKLESENNGEEVHKAKTKLMQRAKDTCGALGMYGFITAIGVGFVAYSTTHIYICFCAPSGIWGFIQSLVVMDSTFCQILLALIHHSQSLYGAMMVAFLFSLIGAMGKGIAWMTGQAERDIPNVVQSRGILRNT